MTVEEFVRDRRLGIGQLELDLRDLPAGTTTTTEPLDVTARVGVGRLLVRVPDDVTLELHTDLGAGHVVLDGNEIADGVRAVDDRLVRATGASVASIRLDLTVGAGEIAIERTATSR